MERKVKLGLTPAGIVSIVFGVLGLIYFILGMTLGIFPADEEDLTVGIFFAILGGVFLLIALIIFLCTVFRKKHLQTIVEAGRYLWGEIVDILPNYNVQANSSSGAYVILVRYTDRHGRIHIFRSPVQKTYPDRSVIGKQVKVYYENDSFKNYYVDLEGVLPPVIEH